MRQFDIDTSKMIRQYAGQDGAVTSLAVTSNETLLASGSSAGSIRLWNAADGSDKGSLVGHVGVVVDVVGNLPLAQAAIASQRYTAGADTSQRKRQSAQPVASVCQ